jgi:hypothetical protein
MKYKIIKTLVGLLRIFYKMYLYYVVLYYVHTVIDFLEAMSFYFDL